MGYYVGLDVSLKSTHICVLDGERRVVWRGVSDTQIAMIAEHLARWGEQIVLVGLETGSLTPWRCHRNGSPPAWRTRWRSTGACSPASGC